VQLPYADMSGNERMGGDYTPPAGETVPKIAVNGTIRMKLNFWKIEISFVDCYNYSLKPFSLPGV
jgi:hypothetical protein